MNTIDLTLGIPGSKIELVRTCPECNVHYAIILVEEHFDAWLVNTIQEAFPYLSPEQREMIMTGMHPDCWDNLFDDEVALEETQYEKVRREMKEEGEGAQFKPAGTNGQVIVACNSCNVVLNSGHHYSPEYYHFAQNLADEHNEQFH